MRGTDPVTPVFLSILSSPGKLGFYRNLDSEPGEIAGMLTDADFKVQEHIAGIYGDEPVRAAERIIERCCKSSFRIISYWDPDYPPLLKEIHRPPIVLYVRGEFHNCNMISIVGTRNSDRNSEDIAARISSALSIRGFTIVSGMAYGIDRFAHLGALSSGGSTVGVLPGGIDGIYPYRNRDLYEMVERSRSSSLVSEYPPSVPCGQKWTFTQRNRIISGLSSALIVIQAPRESGAMITARYAIEQNRDLFVCPGNSFDRKYEGCHDLLKEGAAIISSMDDIISEVSPGDNPGHETADITPVPLSGSFQAAASPVKQRGGSLDLSTYAGVERDILQNLNVQGVEIDTFIRSHGYTAEEVSGALISLEIAGVIIRRGNSISLKT